MKGRLTLAIVCVGLLVGALWLSNHRPRTRAASNTVTTPVMLGAQLALDSLHAVEDLRFPLATSDSGNVARMLVSENGAMMVPRPNKQSLQFYSPTGQQLVTFGSWGGAPGHFIDQRSVGWVGDTIWTWDATRRVVTYISADGRFLDEEGLHVAWGTINNPFFAILTPFAVMGNRFLVIGNTLGEFFHRSTTHQRLLFSIDSYGVIHHVFGEQPVPSDSDVVRVGFSGMLVPFRAVPLLAISDDGRRLAWLSTHIAGPDAGTFHLTIVNNAGDTLASRDYHFVGIPIPRSVADQAVDTAANRADGPLGAMFREKAPALMPPIYPPVTALIIGQDSTIWIARTSSTTEQEWMLLDPLGSPVATVTLPRIATVVAARRDRLWTIVKSPDAAPTVVRYLLK